MGDPDRRERRMPIDVNYEDDNTEEDTSPKKTTNSSAPAFNDTSEFPEAEWGPGAASAPAPATGKTMAELAAETIPEQKSKIDLDKPIIIKVPRAAPKTRIQKVREAYKKVDDRKSLMNKYKVYHDDGLPEGVSEKKVLCEMTQVGSDIEILRDFEKTWQAVLKMPLDAGSNVRVFRSEIIEPSPENESISKGGKYQIRASKQIARDMMEELCLYLLDNRLDPAIIGVCWCPRANYDLVQMWTKKEASPSSVEVFNDRICTLLGATPATTEVEYDRHSDPHNAKLSKARKYYLAEATQPSQDGVVLDVNTVLQMREYGKKKEKTKTGPDDFSEVGSNKPKHEKKADEKEEIALKAAATTASAAKKNEYDLLNDGEDDETEEAQDDDVQIFEKKKSEKTRKGSTRKGSKKGKKSSNDDFEFAGTTAPPLIPQQVFVGAGLGGILLIALLAIFMSGVMN